MKKFRIRFFACVAVGMFGPLSYAGYKMNENGTVPATKAEMDKTRRIKFPESHAPQKNVEHEVNEGLSKMYTVPVDRIEYFRKLHHGYEEIVPSLVVAREAQVEPGRVLKMRMEGKSWKDIAASFSIELKPLNAEVVDVLKPIRKALPKEALSERPQTRG